LGTVIEEGEESMGLSEKVSSDGFFGENFWTVSG
jgi:hypothetical protein